jgi:hypothetical protein
MTINEVKQCDLVRLSKTDAAFLSRVELAQVQHPVLKYLHNGNVVHSIFIYPW